MSELGTTTIYKMTTELTMLKTSSNNPKNGARIVKPRNLSKDSLQKQTSNQADSSKTSFGSYCLKPKRPQNSPLIYSTCQSIINTSSVPSPSYYLNPINKQEIINETCQNPEKTTAKILVIPPIPPPPTIPPPSTNTTTPAISEDSLNKINSNSCSNLLRRTSFADLQKQKLISACKDRPSPTITNDALDYITISRMVPDDESSSPKILPPTSNSPSDLSFKNMISGCAFNYCDSAVSILNKSTNKLKKSNSTASSQYFGQNLDKISNETFEKKLKDKKLSHSNMDINIEEKSSSLLFQKKEELKMPKLPPPRSPKTAKNSDAEQKKDELNNNEIYSFNKDGKLTKSCSTSYINNGKKANGITYIKVKNIQNVSEKTVLVNDEIAEFRLDVEKQKFENELREKGLLNESIKKTEQENLNNDDSIQIESSKENRLKELSKIFENNSKSLIDQDEIEEAKDKLKEINPNSNNLKIFEITQTKTDDQIDQDVIKILPKFSRKKTESFNYDKMIKNGSSNKKYVHSPAPLILRSKRFFQQETHIPPHPGQTVNLKRNTSLPAKTLIRKNMSQFYDIRSKIQQFENINTDPSSFNHRDSLIINTKNLGTSQSNQYFSPNKLAKNNNENNVEINEPKNVKVPEDFQSTVKVKQLKYIFESGNGNYSLTSENNSIVKD